jgi:GDP-D-mannose dehydratase
LATKELRESKELVAYPGMILFNHETHERTKGTFGTSIVELGGGL